jgi:hypothetical protein
MSLRTRTLGVVALAALAVGTIPLHAQTQGRGQGTRGTATQAGQQQAQQAQQQAQTAQQQRLTTQMQSMVQRMTQLQTRAQTLAEGVRSQTRNRIQTTERERLMLGTCEALEGQARQMGQLAERAHEMVGSREFTGDRLMQRDMEQLRRRLQTMANELEGSLQLMERVRQRTQTQTQTAPVPPT